MSRNNMNTMREEGFYHYGGEGLLWYYQDGRENYSRRERPYSYSPFFLFGDHASIERAECDYTDRYGLWDADRLDSAKRAAGITGFGVALPISVYQRFVEAYYGQGTKLVGVVEWCNVSNGYPCWSLHFNRALDQEGN